MRITADSNNPMCVLKIADGEYVAEASTLGLPPGLWPEEIVYQGLVYEKHRRKDHGGGELAGWSYKHFMTGNVLVVYND